MSDDCPGREGGRELGSEGGREGRREGGKEEGGEKEFEEAVQPLSVCAFALITCAICYIVRYYATAVYSSFWRFTGQATANEGSCELPRWRKLGRQP